MNHAPPASARQARVLIPFLIVTLIWGSTWLVIRDQVGSVPASWSVTYRFIIASATMFAYAALRGEPLRLDRRVVGFVILFGIAQFVFNFNFVYRAASYITSGLIAVVFALLLVPNAIFSRIFLGQRMSWSFLAGSAVALMGIGLLFIHEIEASSTGPVAVYTGIALTFAGVLSASAANVMQATERARLLPMATMLAWSTGAGALVDGIYAWTTSGPPVIDLRPGYIAGVLYLGLVASAIAFTLYFGVIRAIGAARAAYSSVLIPIIAMTLSTIFEGYVWSWESIAGCVLTLSGLVVALSARRPAR